MSDLISRQAAINAVEFGIKYVKVISKETGEVIALFEESNAELKEAANRIKQLPPAQPEIIRCKDCKHNPKLSWFGCPMSHLSEAQRPETAWCWKAERREVTT